MSSTVARTCTELVVDIDSGHILTKSQPLSAFDHLRAYVLLGDAGSGKTTEFNQEKEALGDSAGFLSAGDFTTLDVDSHPEWREKTLFIDGLDEMRAGTSDSLTPLDQIRRQLDRLGRPNFRLSCREADWLGTNDRQKLATVSADSQITVLRLDPLDDDAIATLLTSLDVPSDAQEFIDEARQRGLGAILHNPQTLKLLAEAVGQGGSWPKSRRETFELACRNMASEENKEHIHRGDWLKSEAILDAAGYLCAVQLIAGSEGYSLTPLLDHPSFPSVDELLEPPDQLSHNSLRRALGTRLFSGTYEQRVRPVHRHVAEFLGGRYLAKLIGEGLPASRAMSLITSPSNQKVVTVLRGLSAWLAVHSREARPFLMKADPVGVGLYGDIEGFSSDEKRHLLESLATFAEQGPLFGHERSDDRGGWHRGSTAQAFKSLAAAEMVPAIKDLLTWPTAEARNGRAIGFVLDVLSEADEAELDTLTELCPDLEAILGDPAMSPDVRRSALDAYLHLASPNETKTQFLERVLGEVNKGVHQDPLDELRGTLLSHLYPVHLAPKQLWQFLNSPNEKNFIGGRFWMFHQKTLLEKSSEQQVAELLDALHENSPPPLASVEDSGLGELPIQVLARGLEKHGDDVEPARLYNWLSTTSHSLRTLPRAREPLQSIQTWLQARPEIQKDVYLAWLRHRHLKGDSSFGSYWSCNALNESTPPADFGLWCLKMAVELERSELPISLVLLKQAYGSLQQQSGSHGLTLEVMKEQVHGHSTLTSQLDELCKPSPPSNELSTFEREMQDRMSKYDEEKRQRQAEWEDLLRSRMNELRENRISPRFLDVLAHVYFALYTETDSHASPQYRISDFVGGDPEVVDCVVAALRNAVWRDDLPEAQETISLHSQSKRSLLEYPVLASLELVHKEEPTLVDAFDDTHKRKALAIHFFAPSIPGHNAASPCLSRWLQQRPDLVLDVLYQCAVSTLRAGETYIPGLNDLDNMARNDRHPDLVHGVRLRLLEAFPVRAPNTQHEVLDRLLGETLRYQDTAKLEALATNKLASTSMTVGQRVRWLAVGALINPSQHRQPLRTFAGESEMRARELAEFFRNSNADRNAGSSSLNSDSDPAVLRDLIEVLGRWYGPRGGSGRVTLEMDASDRISNWTGLLGSMGNDQADQALSHVIDDPQLAKWLGHLSRAWERQKAVLRDAAYSHSSIEQVQRTLKNGLPANAADLAALLIEHLNGIAEDIRGSSSNLWRQFWNEEPELKAKREEACRDALLAMLTARLPSEVDATREGNYVSDKRADIRVSYGGFNVPIEIKKDSHRGLWSALQEQLVDKYSSTDPATSGHGIYLVLWTGGDKIRRRPDVCRPATPDELRELLEGDLTPDQASKISVRVLDVTKP